MKQFSTLRQAINYETKCPLCSADINAISYDVNVVNNTLVWKTVHDDLVLDLDTNQIINYTITMDSTPVYGQGAMLTTFKLNGQYDMEFLRYKAGCSKCCGYDFTIQICLDLKIKMVSLIVLNSEFISFDEKGITYEIRNIYTTECTEYRCFGWPNNEGDVSLSDEHKTIHDKMVTLPLIALDINRPQKTLDRIRTLIPFS